MRREDFEASFGTRDGPTHDRWEALVALAHTQTIKRPQFRVRGTWHVVVRHLGYDSKSEFRAHVERVGDRREVVFTQLDPPRKGQTWTWHEEGWRDEPLGLLSFIDDRVAEYVSAWDDFLTIHGVEFPAFEA